MLEGPTGLARGLRKGTGALVSGVASGLVGYTASVVGTASSGVSLMAQGIVSLSNGEEQDVYLQERENKRRLFKASAGGVFNGFKQGGMDVLSGMASGMKGLVAKPVQEGRKAGALGVMKGMGMGLVGVVVKPVLGISDGITSVAAGFTTQMLADSSALAKHQRPPRALERANPLSGKVLILLPMDVFAAQAQLYLKTANEKDEYLASCTLGYQMSSEYPHAEYGLLLSTNRVYLLSATAQTLWDISFSELSHIVLKKNLNPNSVGQDQGQYGVVGFVLYGCSLAVTKTVTCPSRLHAIKLYGFLLKFAYRMGNPAANIPLEDILAEEVLHRSEQNTEAASRDRGAHERALGLSLDTYIFGYANNMNLPMTLSHSFASENSLLETARDSFAHIFCDNMSDKDAVYFYRRQIDEAMYQLVMNWKHSHMIKLTPSHGYVCLLMNNAPSYAPVQLVDMELIEGKDYLIFSVGDGYDPVSRTIAPNGGGVVIFAYGPPPALNDAPSVKLFLTTTAFSCNLSSLKGEPNCTNHNGYIVGYLEKAQGDLWSKAVIDITLQK